MKKLLRIISLVLAFSFIVCSLASCELVSYVTDYFGADENPDTKNNTDTDPDKTPSKDPITGGTTPKDPLPEFVMPEGGYDGSAVTIRFYHSMNSHTAQILERAVENFNLFYPNITVECVKLSGYDGVRDQILRDIKKGTQPHLAYCYTDHVALYNASDAVQTLDVFINDPNVGYTQTQIDDFIDAFYNEGKSFGDDKMYCLPLSKSTEVLYYNKSFFEMHNLSVPRTWDEMEEVCKQIKEIDPDSIPLGYDSEYNWFINMCEQYGSPYTSATGENFLFNNEMNILFVTRFRDWFRSGLVTTAELYGAYSSEMFVGNDGVRCYMCIGSSAGAPYHMPDMVDGEYEFEVGITSIPQLDPTNPKAIIQGPSICMFKQENPQEMLATWLFAKFLTTDLDFQGAMSMVTGYMPVIESIKEHPAYALFLSRAGSDGVNNIAAYAVKVALAQENAYYASPAFFGSTVAREQVGLIMQKCFFLPDEGLEAAIRKVFEDAIAECKQQTGQ